jgi:hypothetical protein
MPADTLGFALADLHAGSRKVNEPLDELGPWSGAAESIPEAFPGFV